MTKYAVVVALVAIFVAGLWYASREPVEAPVVEQEKPVKETYMNAEPDFITVATPQPGAHVASTFTVSGQARGHWYFEASFPLEVLDANGTQLLIQPVQADGEWMTTEFVPFSTTITVPQYSGKATLVLHRDNASGLPEHDRSVSIPIVIQ
jgi:hypothetical protein